MSDLLVAGTINLEVTLAIDQFPLSYAPVVYRPFGISMRPGGVGYNIARALTTLGVRVRFLALVDDGPTGASLAAALARDGIATRYLVQSLAESPQSVVLVDQAGRRQINTDLKDLQAQRYPAAQGAEALAGCSLAVLTNVNFSRPLLAQARALGIPIATDLHAIDDLESAYNRDFMEAADVLFMSHERLPEPPERWAARLLERYHAAIVVVGLGAEGALLAVRADGFVGRLPAVSTRPVVNTTGAGDALFAAFCRLYSAGADPYQALRKALVFASYKIGEHGSAQGFLDGPALERLAAELGGG